MVFSSIKAWGILGGIVAASAALGGTFSLGVNYGQNKQQVQTQTTQDAYDEQIRTLERQLVSIKDQNDAKVKQMVSQLDEQYQRGVQETQAWYITRDIIDNANEHGGLSIDVVPAACPSTKDTDSGSTVTASGDHAPRRAQLSTEAAEFLINEARRADAVAEQLYACQQLVNIYYSTIEQVQLDLKTAKQ